VVSENKDVQITSDLEQDQESLGTEVDEQKKPDQMQEMKNLLVEQDNRIKGLQSKVDKGLNTIRKDSQERAMQQAQSEVEKLKEKLEDLDPSLRPFAEQQVKAAEDRVKTMSQDIPDSSLGQNPTSTSEMDEVRKIAENAGVDPNDSGINYAALFNNNIDINDRQKEFFDSLWKVKNKTATPTKPNETAPQPTDNPPTDGTPTAGSGMPKNITELHQAYASGRMPKEEYLKQKQRMGG
jgi:seryl-tRNA synthetase|tara:strand:+ start:989 stop:1702 length:714 start_codon:yes stop_codon:yes gene_type:complete